MEYEELDGARMLAFVKQFDYIREAGTGQERRAASQLAEALHALGLQPVTESFSFEEEQPECVSLCVTAAANSGTGMEKEPVCSAGKTYRITACDGSADTAPEGLEAPLCCVENADEISLRQAKGCIALSAVPVRGEVFQRLAASGAVGFLDICGTPFDQGTDRIPVCRSLAAGDGRRLPGGTIHYLDAMELIEAGDLRVRLTVRRRAQRCESQNVRVRLPGTDKAEEMLTLTGHYDSVPQGPGAYDNMASGAMLLELCRYFQRHRTRRTLEFVWFGAEEKGMKGSLAYVERRREELARHVMNLNIDLAGQAVGGNVLGITADASVCTWAERVLQKEAIGAALRQQVWASDSNSFAWKGVPALTLNRDGFGMHTSKDTAALLSPYALKKGCETLGALAEDLGNAKELPFIREIPEAMRRELERSFGV